MLEGATVLFSAFENGGEMWTGSGQRLVRHPVRFDEGFVSPPVVHLSLSMWDVAGDANQRLDLRAAEITETGFVIEFRTWEDTRVARVRASWIAIGPVRHQDDFAAD